MSKFKVGDKVRVLPYDKKFLCTGIGEQALKKIAGNLYTITGVRNGGVAKHWYYLEETKYVLAEEMLELSEQPRREFIVIRLDGNVMIAEHRVNREVIKSAKATCAPTDTFDFDTGAKLAFDRLMGREEPKHAHRFKVGDRVVVLGKYSGEISAIDDQNKYNEFYLVYCTEAGFHSGGEHGVHCKPEHLGKCTWRGEKDLSPAPEPPKYYTGKVVMVDCEFPDRKHLINHLFEFKDGRQVGNKMHGMSFNYAPYTSFEQIVSTHNASTWIEVKE